jgi:hypothetical protein
VLWSSGACPDMTAFSSSVRFAGHTPRRSSNESAVEHGG